MTTGNANPETQNSNKSASLDGELMESVKSKKVVFIAFKMALKKSGAARSDRVCKQRFLNLVLSEAAPREHNSNS